MLPSEPKVWVHPSSRHGHSPPRVQKDLRHSQEGFSRVVIKQWMCSAESLHLYLGWACPGRESPLWAAQGFLGAGLDA